MPTTWWKYRVELSQSRKSKPFREAPTGTFQLMLTGLVIADQAKIVPSR